MTVQPIERLGHRIEGNHICYDERPISWTAIEQKAGRRLDRRRAYAVVEGNVCEMVRWSGSCSGCTVEGGDRGMGCTECGHTGRRRSGAWVPITNAGEGD